MLWVGGARHPKGVVFFRFKCWGLSLHEGNGLHNWEICFWWKLSRTKVCKLRTGWAKAAHSPANQNDSFNVLQRKLCRTHRALLQASLILTAANHAIFFATFKVLSIKGERHSGHVLSRPSHRRSHLAVLTDCAHPEKIKLCGHVVKRGYNTVTTCYNTIGPNHNSQCNWILLQEEDPASCIFALSLCQLV